MALRDFISDLAKQSDEGVIYSKNPEPVTKIIPPTTNKQKVEMKDTTRVIVPTKKSSSEPVIIKFTGIDFVKSNHPKTLKITTNKVKETKVETVKENDKKNSQPKEVKKMESENEKIERLFKNSDTNIKYKNDWIEYYKLAQEGKSLGKGVNSTKVKLGEFQIDEVEGSLKIFYLSDYKTSNKDTKKILGEKWI